MYIEALYKGIGHRSFISRPSAKATVIDFHMFSYRGPLQRYWSSIFYIKALCKSMVIDLSYQGPLRWNGHWFSYVFISRPSTKVLVIDLLYRGPLQMQWSLIFICFHIEAFYKGTGHRSFILRPSANELVIDLSYQDPLRWNGHCFS